MIRSIHDRFYIIHFFIFFLMYITIMIQLVCASNVPTVIWLGVSLFRPAHTTYMSLLLTIVTLSIFERTFICCMISSTSITTEPLNSTRRLPHRFLLNVIELVVMLLLTISDPAIPPHPSWLSPLRQQLPQLYQKLVYPLPKVFSGCGHLPGHKQTCLSGHRAETFQTHNALPGDVGQRRTATRFLPTDCFYKIWIVPQWLKASG